MLVERIYVTFFFILIAFPCASSGQWMEGADIYYTCLGNGAEPNTRLYKFHLDLYVACDFFPPEFTFSHYVSQIADDSGNGLGVIWMDFTQGGQVENPDFACAEIPDEVCIKRWQFEGQRELPILDSTSYYVLLGNCCLDSSVSNILGSDTSGLTIILPITPAAQKNCNSSPYFESLPPTILCQNENFTLTSQATDLDGDQLVYKFCAINGYYIDGMFSAPPPLFFSNLLYNFPLFSPSQPLGMGGLAIDATTGTLSGTPTTEGKFMVGICVEEYRNGELLSTIARNFQFNVLSCEKEVSAAIDVQNFQGDIPVISHCIDSNLVINNLSTALSNGTPSIRWIIQHDQFKIESTDWDPEFDLPYSGIYEGRLFLNENEVCEDSLAFIIQKNKLLQADFLVDYDSCQAGPLRLHDHSISDIDSIRNYFWNVEDTTIISDSKIALHYLKAPGIHTVFHQVEDQFGCVDSIYRNINWQPAPKVVILSPNVSDGCLPLSVEFTNLSWPVDSSYIVNWNFGDEDNEGEMEGIIGIHTYNKLGLFSPSIEIISPLGCQVSQTFEDLITVNLKPLADFSWKYNLNSSNEYEVYLTSNVSETSYQWYLNGDLFSNLANAVYQYPVNIPHSIMLVVTNNHGCSDSLSQEITLNVSSELFLPNAFTPNSDGENDVFEVVGFIESISNFEIKIYNRFGTIVFSTENPGIGWNGRTNNSGVLNPNGVYIYKLDYLDISGVKHNKKGFVTLIK